MPTLILKIVKSELCSDNCNRNTRKCYISFTGYCSFETFLSFRGNIKILKWNTMILFKLSYIHWFILLSLKTEHYQPFQCVYLGCWIWIQDKNTFAYINFDFWTWNGLCFWNQNSELDVKGPSHTWMWAYINRSVWRT